MKIRLFIALAALFFCCKSFAGAEKQLEENMKAIYEALYDFAYNNDGCLPRPAGLKGLTLLARDEYLLKPAVYTDPRVKLGKTLPKRYNTYTELEECFCGFTYLGNGEKLSVTPPIPVLRTKPLPGQPVFILFSDGKIHRQSDKK